MAIADAGRARLSAMLCFEHPSLAGVDAPQDKLQVRHHVGLNFFRHKLEGEEEGKQHVLLLRVPGKPPSGGHSDYEEDETEGEEEEEEDSCINLRWWAKLSACGIHVISDRSVFAQHDASTHLHMAARLLRVLSLQVFVSSASGRRASRAAKRAVRHTFLELEVLRDLSARAPGDFVRFRPLPGLCYVPVSNTRWSIAQRLPVFLSAVEPGTYLLNHRVYRTCVDRWPTADDNDDYEGSGAEDEGHHHHQDNDDDDDDESDWWSG